MLNKSIDTVVAKKAYTPEKISSWITSLSNITQDNKSIFFICKISNQCKIKELLRYENPNRIEIDLITGNIHIWNVSYHSDNPDLIIESAYELR
jgi:hypothetical protein